jgi:CSLREA domain-containing protein
MRADGESIPRVILAMAGAMLLAGTVPAARAATPVSFSNTAAITINDNATASPYPSTITVSGIAPALPTGLRVTLNGLSHSFEADIDILLVGPQGQRAVLSSDAGGSSVVSGVTVGFDAMAATAVPASTPLLSGSVYRPVNYFNSVPDGFPFALSTNLDAAPADLTAFNLQNPNGVWGLWVVDDAANDAGSISGGWSLTFTVPSVFTVNSTNDPGDGTCNASECTLREAVAAAGSGDLVQFSALFNSAQSITLTAGEILINKNLTVQGPGADKLILSGNNASRLFRVAIGSTLSLNGLALRDGRAGDVGGAVVSDGNLFLRGVEVSNSTAAAGFSGGGLYIAGGAGVISASSIHDNRAGSGAGVEVINADATIDNSTIAANTAGSEGGGVHLVTIAGGAPKSLELRQSTIAENRAASGAGLAVQANGNIAATAALRDSLIADNIGGNLATNGTGASLSSRGFNLASDGAAGALTATGDQVNVDPRLGPLSQNGGVVPSMALLGGSPAIDAGHSSGGQFDQRGIFRLFDVAGIAVANSDGGDIGAVEMRPLIVTTVNDSGSGSLREAIQLADNGGSGLDDILFDNSVFNVARSIDLMTALPDITGDLALHGPGADRLTVRRSPAAPGHFRIFHNPGGNTRAAFSGLTIANGLVDSGSVVVDVGGGIRSNGPLALSAVHVTGNQAAVGGGVAVVFASGVIDGCTFSGNTGVVEGGGILFQGNGPHRLTLRNSTVSNNQVGPTGFGGGIEVIGESGRGLLRVESSTIVDNAGDNGGGIDTSSFGATGAGITQIVNSIVAGNTPNNFNAVPDVGGGTAVQVSLGFNLSNNFNGVVAPLATDLLANASLRPLGSYGGGVPTRLPMDNSPALDAGNSLNAGHDQRGGAYRRAYDIAGVNDAAPAGDRSDIGAVELAGLDAVFKDGFE